MNHANAVLFEWIAAWFAAAPWTLPLVRAAAVDSAYVVAALAAWSFVRQPAQRRYIVFVLAACGVTSLLSHYLAAVTGVSRPFVVGLSPLYISHHPTGSLPSSHAAVLLLIALLYCQRKPLRPFGMAMLVLALVTGVARVCVGVHFPLDIAAGFLLAAVLAVLFRGVEHMLRRHLETPAVRHALNGSGEGH
ncbi:MAG: hypothetical protein JWP29_4360 [Rhodoferax sp.]|nr:hypothetical protein [Rhodoferax sp.]